MRRLLITGAAGFIGFHLARYFRALGDAVWGIDLFNSYYDPKLKHARADLLKDEGVTITVGDICDESLLRSLITQHQITNVVHMAAQAGVRYSSECPQAYVKANIEGFVSVLEACRAFPDVTLTYASSSSVYGSTNGSPSPIDARADTPASFYGATKRSNELMARAYYELYGLRSTGLRYFTVYGPWGRPDMAYFSFTESIIAGKPIFLSGGGSVRRSFTYIDDIVMGTAAALERPATCDLFNLGHPSSVPITHLLHLIEEQLGITATIISQPIPTGDVAATCADISKSSTLLAFQPRTELSEGIAKFVTWYRAYTTARRGGLKA